MTGQRVKLAILLGGLIASGLVLVGWTQSWFALELSSGPSLAVTGDVAAGGLAALALSGLALGAALAIAGPVFRVILGALEVAIGGLVTLSAALAITDPVRASLTAITAATGESGEESARQLVSEVTATPWPALALALGVVLALLGLLVVITSRRWPLSSRKYQAVRLEPAESERSAVGDWDALSDGRDPT